MDPDLIKKLLEMPWHLQLVLSSGYCAYLVAYLGIRHDHKAADTFFCTLAFGIVAVGTLALTASYSKLTQAIITGFATLIAGVLWRTLVRTRFRHAIRNSGYSWNDSTASAWASLLQEQHIPTQLTIELKDGRYLLCTDTSRVGKMPMGPYVLGWTGDALLYVDQSISADGNVKIVEDAFDDNWGNLLTYIPKDEIRKISIRYLSPLSESGATKLDDAKEPTAAG